MGHSHSVFQMCIDILEYLILRSTKFFKIVFDIYIYINIYAAIYDNYQKPEYHICCNNLFLIII